MAKKRPSGIRGYSLVELMVTVAIAGTLAAIAIPNYQGYVARSRQTEAKTALTWAYTAEQAFFTESGYYTSCLADIGFKISGQQRYYAVGFTAAAAGASTCGTAGTAACNTTNTGTCAVGTVTGGEGTLYKTVSASNVRVNGTLGFPADGSFPTVGIGKAAFSAGAVGNISGRSGASFDKWTIDHTKNLLNSTLGL